jgi:hypothetical protein
MRSTTGFHDNESRGLTGDQGQQLPPGEYRIRFERALVIHHADLKNMSLNL